MAATLKATEMTRMTTTLKATTVSHALDALSTGPGHWWLIVHVSFARFAVAFADQLAPYAFPGIAAEFELISGDELGMYAAAAAVGNLLGNLIAGTLDGGVGRVVAIRYGFAVAAISLLTAALLASSFRMLLVLRTVQQGAMNCAAAAFAIWLQEHLPKTGRGTLYTIAILGWPFGKEAMIGLAALLDVDRWRALLLASGVLMGAVALSVLRVRESPRQLAASGEPEAALQALRALYKANNTPCDYNALASEPQSDMPSDHRGAAGGSSTAVDGTARGVDGSSTLPRRVRRLCQQFPRYTVFATCLFSALGLTTQLLDTYGPSVFQRLLFPASDQLPYAVMMLFNLGDTLGVFASVLLVERLGRRGCLAFGFLGQATFLLTLVALSQGLPPTPLVLSCVLMPVGMLAASFRVYHWDGAQLWTLEAFPTELRATALAVAKVVMQCVVSLVLSDPHNRTALREGQPVPQLLRFCAALATCGVVFSATLPIETRGRAMH